MHDFMQNLQKHITVGIVGGSDYKKITEQLGKLVEIMISTSKELEKNILLEGIWPKNVRQRRKKKSLSFKN